MNWSEFLHTLKNLLFSIAHSTETWLEAKFGSENGDSPNIAGLIAILSFILLLCLGVICLVICVKRKEKNARKNKKTENSDDYNSPLGFNGGLGGRLNDVSTGSADIPGWSKEKNVVSAEKYITGF